MVSRKNPGRPGWHRGGSYTYGSAAYEEEEISFPRDTDRSGRQPKKIKKQNKMARQVGLLIGLVLSLVFVNVALSELYFVRCNALVELKKTEALCQDKNEALKIDVERLRSPQRITAIAEKELGMKTARSNIYVQTK